MFHLNIASNFLQSLNEGRTHEYNSYESEVGVCLDFSYSEVDVAGPNHSKMMWRKVLFDSSRDVPH